VAVSSGFIESTNSLTKSALTIHSIISHYIKAGVGNYFLEYSEELNITVYNLSAIQKSARN
jgi:hypothetical protein